MSHAIAKYNNGSVFTYNALRKEYVAANAFAIMVFLLAVNFYEKTIGHVVLTLAVRTRFET
jgi:hypothetical protein